MAYSKIILNGETLMDVTSDTVDAGNLLSGETATKNSGAKVTGNIASKSSSDLTVSGATVTAPSGYYSASVSKSVASGTAGTPTATKGTVSNHAINVTPSVTNTTGYITGSTKNGTAVTVSAAELVSGTKSISSNGTDIDVTNYQKVDVAVPSGTTLPTFTFTDPTTVTCDMSFNDLYDFVSQTNFTTAICDYGNGVVVTASMIKMDALGAYIIYTTFTDEGFPEIDLTYNSNGTITITYPSSLIGAEGTPTVIKGSVSNHSVSITPSVTNTAGYITGSTKTGTAVSVSASELVSGTKSITSNGTGIDVTNYANVDVAVPSSGGETASKKQINFIDYDGTILHSYTASEWASVTALPSNPAHNGLVAQGWNWTKAQIDAQLTAMPDGDVWVGQMYITSSGDTEIDLYFADSARLSPILTIAVNGTVTVDWGDNTTPDTVTGTSLTTRQTVSHTYASTGEYTMVIHVVSGSFQFYGSSNYQLLRKNTTSNQNIVYTKCVEAVRFGSGVTSIGTYAFYYCHSLTSVTIPSGVTSIGTYAFNSCYCLTSVTIPSSVTSIERDTFNGCYSLTSVTIPSGVTSIGNNAFYYCHPLTSVTIPSGVTSIGDNAFNSCDSLTSVTIPSGVTSIGTYAFYCCYCLTSVTIPSSVTSIVSNAFNGCYCLTNITIPSGVTSIGTYAFSGCRSLTSVTIPSGVTSIGNNAFNNCLSLGSITISSDVTSIGNNVFAGCYSLASVTIPSGVTSIGGGAFSSCYGVAEYHIKPTTPPTLGTNAFSNIVSDCIIYVPSASLSEYQSATNWSTYSSYMVGE